MTPATRSRSASWDNSVASRRHDSDHAVAHSPRQDARGTAPAVDAGRGREVGNRVEAEQLEAVEEASQPCLEPVAPRAGKHLHHDRLGHRDRSTRGDEIGQSPIGRAPRRAVVLDPGRRVGEDHATARGGASGGGSSSAPAPRMARASSLDIGWPARWRSARSTASVFARMPYRSMMVATDATSSSMFVRALVIHQVSAPSAPTACSASSPRPRRRWPTTATHGRPSPTSCAAPSRPTRTPSPPHWPGRSPPRRSSSPRPPAPTSC